MLNIVCLIDMQNMASKSVVYPWSCLDYIL